MTDYTNLASSVLPHLQATFTGEDFSFVIVEKFNLLFYIKLTFYFLALNTLAIQEYSHFMPRLQRRNAEPKCAPNRFRVVSADYNSKFHFLLGPSFCSCLTIQIINKIKVIVIK